MVGRTVLASVDVFDVRAEQTVEQRITSRLRRCGAVEHENTLHAKRGRRRGRDARVIRLQATRRNQRVGARCHGLGAHEAHLANFVSAKRERNRVVTLHQESRAAAKSLPESRHLFDRCDVRRQRQ